MLDQPLLHPTDQVLSDFGLGRLDDQTAESVHQHLEECPGCRLRVAELSSDGFLDRLRGAQRSPSAPALAEFSDYQIIRELGRGGMGVVYLAHNQLMGRDEVLKVVSQHLLDRKGILERFLREIRAAAKLHHPNVVSAYSAFRSGESIVFAMEYVAGLDLAKMVAAKGPLPVAHACYFVHQVTLGLQHAHEQGLVHRDIKPANLMLARDGKRAIVKVLDFGLAKATREQPHDGGLTSEGQMLGTPDCIAPEQIRDAQSADIRADIYSLGCTLYYLLTGGPPFRAQNLWDLYQAHFSMDADPLNLVRPEVPVELAALVAKMMAKEPERRFQTPAEVARALTPFFKPEPVQAAPLRSDLSAADAPSTVAAEPQPVPAPPRPDTRWESLIDFKAPEPTPASALVTPPAQPPRGPRRVWPWIAAAGGFVAVVLLGIVIHITIERNRVTVDVQRTPEVAKRVEKAPVPPAAEKKTEPERPVIEAKPAPEPASPPAAPAKVLAETRPASSPERDDPWPQSRNPGGLVFPAMNGPILALSQDGRLVAQHQADQPLRITKAPDPAKALECGAALRLAGATFSPDGTSIAGHGDSQFVTLWDTASGKEVRQLIVDDKVPRHTADVAFSADGTLLAAVIFQFHRIKVFDTATGQLQHTLAGHTTNPRSAAFSPDGPRLASGGGVQGEKGDAPGELKLWGLATGECQSLAGHAVRTQSVVFSTDGRFLVSAGADRLAKVWDVKTLACVATFDRHTTPLAGARFSPDGRLVASVARENAVRVWERATGREVAVLTGFPGTPTLVQFSPRGRWIFAAAKNVLKSWETPAVQEGTPPPSAPAPSVRPAPRGGAQPIATNTVGMRFVLVLAGEFLMGSADTGAQWDEKPQHRVTIARAFSLGETEVTQGQYFAVTRKRPSRFKGSDALPVESVSWLDAVQFCNALSLGEKVPAFYTIDGRTVTVADWSEPGYRLPTEAEWEYACRAGSPLLYSFGNDAAKLGDYAWYYDAGAIRRTHPVGLKRPNAFGLYDMHGNVWEWCWDGHARYGGAPATDPTGPADAEARVFRSGCGEDGGPSAHRNRTAPGSRTDTLGFRVARTQRTQGNGLGPGQDRGNRRGR
jgi:serine/threonine protein kinase/formylglycine-generating enzyme required for sulfatase activity